MEPSSPPVASLRHRTAVLVIVIVGASWAALAQLTAATGPGSLPRLVAIVGVGGYAGFQLLSKRRTDALLIGAGVLFAGISLFDLARMTGFDRGNTLALLLLTSVLYVATRESRSVTLIAGYSALIAGYTVASVILGPEPLRGEVGRLIIGVPGQILLIWITWSIIQSLAHASQRETTRARIQNSLARCSDVLLARRGDEPLNAALKALLDATEADYAYIDVNRVDDEGRVAWEIVADAYGEKVPTGPDTWTEGDYSQIPHVADLLSVGQPARIVVSELPMPFRALYEAEGIQSELMAPIMSGEQWVGTLGYADFWRQDAWSEVEVDGLLRAADMIASFWERESAREGLEELAEAKDRFIATVSHELRTPLAAVVGFAAELAGRLDDHTREEVLEMVDMISSQSAEVAQLVDDLLTAERAASGNLTIKPASFDLLDESRSVADSLGVQLEVTVEGESTPAWADALRTRQIVRNLLTNAHRYGGDKVRLAVQLREAVAVLVVSDNGGGVRGTDADHIFDPYYRSKPEDPKPDSVGLGLAVARQLARMMEGDLVYRRRDGWTCFELTLPTASKPAPALTG